MAEAVHAGDLDEADELQIMSFFAGNGVILTMGKGGSSGSIPRLRQLSTQRRCWRRQPASMVTGARCSKKTCAPRALKRSPCFARSPAPWIKPASESWCSTRPTGHTLLLPDAAQGYQREVQRPTANVPDEVRQLLARLRDPEFARILVVTLARAHTR